jgi:hypothetical protein
MLYYFVMLNCVVLFYVMLLCFVMLYYILLYYYVSCVTLCYFVMLSCVELFYIMLLCYVSLLYYIIIVDLATVIFSPLRTPVLLSHIKTAISVPKYPLTQQFGSELRIMAS